MYVKIKWSDSPRAWWSPPKVVWGSCEALGKKRMKLSPLWRFKVLLKWNLTEPEKNEWQKIRQLKLNDQACGVMALYTASIQTIFIKTRDTNVLNTRRNEVVNAIANFNATATPSSWNVNDESVYAANSEGQDRKSRNRCRNNSIAPSCFLLHDIFICKVDDVPKCWQIVAYTSPMGSSPFQQNLLFFNRRSTPWHPVPSGFRTNTIRSWRLWGQGDGFRNPQTTTIWDVENIANN